MGSPVLVKPIMLQYNPLHCLPSSEELPDSDDSPVDNQLQHLIPGLLEAILALVWSDRMDWYSLSQMSEVHLIFLPTPHSPLPTP